VPRRCRGRLAAATGLSPSTIARIEKGRTEPTVAVLTRIVEACGLELRMSVAKPRLPACEPSDLSVEDRLLENDRLAALHLLGEEHRSPVVEAIFCPVSASGSPEAASDE
jgi:transcriptional regulator with XRE-family HTH domain